MKKFDRSNPRVLLGFGLIVIAILLFFKNIGFAFFGVLLNNWPVILIGVGALLIWGPEKIKQKPRTKFPYILLAVGGVCFLAQHNIFNLSFGTIILPLVLVVIGVHILSPKKGNFCFLKKNRCSSNAVSGPEEEELVKDTVDSDANIDIVAVLGGGNYITRSQRLGDGSIVCVMGGAEIDIREADCVGDYIEIELLAIMGGAEIKIPPHWQVSVDVLPLLGGVSNKTTCLADKMGVAKKTLKISGIAFMGGFEIRN